MKLPTVSDTFKKNPAVTAAPPPPPPTPVGRTCLTTRSYHDCEVVSVFRVRFPRSSQREEHDPLFDTPPTPCLNPGSHQAEDLTYIVKQEV